MLFHPNFSSTWVHKRPMWTITTRGLYSNGVYFSEVCGIWLHINLLFTIVCVSGNKKKSFFSIEKIIYLGTQ